MKTTRIDPAHLPVLPANLYIPARPSQLTIIPPKTMNQKMPPLNMTTYTPASWLAERKQLVSVCERLHAENAWLLSRMMIYLGLVFLAGFILGALLTLGTK